MSTFEQLAPGTVFAGDFRVVRPLSQGGMGAVYVVQQLSTGAERALKLMHPQLVADPRLRERFELEARVGSRIESDQAVQVVGAGVDAATGMPWLAMELLRGTDLAERIRTGGAMPAAEVLEVFTQLCHAVGAAHAAGIVHRDLKPENIFLAAPRRPGVPFMVKVLDFGIAKVVAEAQTRQTAAMGSPVWMAPEQTSLHEGVSPATDVWALGLIAFHLLTGGFFWRAMYAENPTPTMLLREIVMEPIGPASQRAAELGRAPLPAGFDAWFARCVDRAQGQRFRDAREAFAALEPILRGGSAAPGPWGGYAPAPAAPWPQPATSLQGIQTALPPVAAPSPQFAPVAPAPVAVTPYGAPVPAADAGPELPRAGVVALTGIIAMLAGVATLMAPMLLPVFGGSAAGAWRIFKDGGASMWLLVLLDLLVPAAVATMGAFVLRGRRLPAAALFGVAALPLAATLLGAWTAERTVLGAISGESVDAEQKVRILAEGTAESMSTDILGGLVVCGAALLACAAAASAAASIDVAARRRAGASVAGFAVPGVIATGGVWFVATAVLAVIRMRAAGAGVLLTVLPLLVIVPFAALAARGLSSLRGCADRGDASRAAGAVIVSLACALLAVLALERAVDAGNLARSLGAISGESVDESQRARILLAGIDGVRLAPAAYALPAVLGTATFGVAIAPAFGAARNPFTPSTWIAAGLGAALLAATLGVGHSRMSAPAQVKSAGGPGGIDLPVIVDTFSHRGEGPGYDAQRVVVARDGTGTGDYSGASRYSAPSSITLYADRAATLAMIRARLPKDPLSRQRVTLVVTRDHPADVEGRLGDLAPFLGRTAYVELRFSDTDLSPESGVMHVNEQPDGTLVVDGAPATLPSDGSAIPHPPGGIVAGIRYGLRPTDTLDQALRTFLSVEAAYAERLPPDSELARDVAVVDAAPSSAGGPPDASAGSAASAASAGSARLGGAHATTAPRLREGATSVNGRLPPEVIQRIVRQNLGRFRLCYEQGLRNNPSLQGRVTVKFVIDRTGSVAMAADGGSDLPDEGVVSCVVRGFGSLSFPQPEGGMVTVVYPIIFNPGT